MLEDYQDTSSPIAAYFRTAVVVDDRVESHSAPSSEFESSESECADESPASGEEVTSASSVPASPRGGMLAPEGEEERPVPMSLLVRAFFEAGLACSVIEASGRDDRVYSMDLPDHAAEHLWILDWIIDGDSSATVGLIGKLIASASDAFLVIVVFTAHNLDDVSVKLSEEFGFSKIDGQPYAFKKDNAIALTIGKPDSILPAEQKRRVLSNHQELPDTIFSDLEKALGGIVPTLVFAAVNQVRSQAPRILSSFSRDLDRPFLLHRMLLTEPDDASAQLLELLAAEFEDVLHESDIVREFGSASAIGQRVEKAEELQKACSAVSEFLVDEERRDISDDVRAPIVNGLADLELLNWIGRGRRGKRLEKLRQRFKVDRMALLRFAALICARRIGKLPPTLEVGIILRDLSGRPAVNASALAGETGSAETEQPRPDGGLLLCIQPRCDSVRLEPGKAAPFPFVPLRELPPSTRDAGSGIAAEPDSFTVIEKNRYLQVAASRKFRDVVFKEFKPSQNGTINAKRSTGTWTVKNIEGVEYGVLCKLRRSFARRVLQSLVADIGRPAIDEMEWLRRYGRNKR